ncbi:hypothetical protein [Ornithinicoccus halotolerans]|uniref:hypothetical protein n=1 Tax=Ornithinicoccus halotolerans TaxID=1748220 RepID=UPI001E520596|nr:hypothetical protein [Ornithinicoccus halotolerans]
MTTTQHTYASGSARDATRASAARAQEVRPARRARPRLSRNGRQAVLLAHLAAAGVWLGTDIVMAVLVGTAVTGGESERALAYLALQQFVLPPLLVASLATLVTGLVLALGTRYGLVRYWWVAAKLVITVVLVVLVLVALTPQVDAMAEAAASWQSGGTADLTPGDLVFPPVVSTAAVLTAYLLSVTKPWGRVRGSRAGRGDRP